MSELCDSHPIVQLISHLSGGISFIIWLVAQLPQTIEIYQNKSVEGISSYFILIWMIGDLTSFVGAILTGQLPFQIVIAAYFLLNDVVLCGQYYYYKFIYKHHHHHKRHSHASLSRRSNGSLVVPAAIVVGASVQSSNALPIMSEGILGGLQPADISIFVLHKDIIGFLSAWIGAGCYFFARIPQLIKNYERKSTQDISPFLFGCTLAGNLTYTISILVSCEYLFSDDSWTFFLNELPYMIGSSGTIIFDIIYFYQVWIYRERDQKKSGEETPLLRSD